VVITLTEPKLAGMWTCVPICTEHSGLTDAVRASP